MYGSVQSNGGTKQRLTRMDEPYPGRRAIKLIASLRRLNNLYFVYRLQ